MILPHGLHADGHKKPCTTATSSAIQRAASTSLLTTTPAVDCLADTACFFTSNVDLGIFEEF
jgi:hypothetical protein